MIIRTVRHDFPLVTHGLTRDVSIVATITNASRETVYLVDRCPGGQTFLARLEKWVEGRWVFAWAPAVCLLEYRPPVVLKPGQTIRDSAVAYQVASRPPQFAVQPIPGTYRAVYNVEHRPRSGRGTTPEPAPLPLPERTSNPFVVGP